MSHKIIVFRSNRVGDSTTRKYKVIFKHEDLFLIPPRKPKPLRTINTTVFKRISPPFGIPFDTEKSNKLVIEALQSNYHHSFYKLIQQFHTQNHPSTCGISTMVVVLNALNIDPEKRWNGIWRWWSEETISCIDLSRVKESGINVDDYITINKCNKVFSILFRPDSRETETKNYLSSIIKAKYLHKERKQLHHSFHQFEPLSNQSCPIRHQVNKYCFKNLSGLAQSKHSYRLCNFELFKTALVLTMKRNNIFTVCSYSRKALSQTGDGHFSPIALYNKSKESILMLDVARFKYSSLWMDIQKAYNSLIPKDSTTGLSRGFMLSGRYF